MTEAPAPGPAPHRPIATPAVAFVGRERELATLREALAAALAGRGSLVLIGGEAGIGKTALAEALLGEATGQGALVLVGRCYDLSETPPYGPWAEALARAPAATSSPPSRRRCCPPHRRRRATGQPGRRPSARARLPRRALPPAARRPPAGRPALGRPCLPRPAARRRPRPRARPALLLATYRADELTRRHPLYALLPLLVREARAARLDPASLRR